MKIQSRKSKKFIWRFRCESSITEICRDIFGNIHTPTPSHPPILSPLWQFIVSFVNRSIQYSRTTVVAGWLLFSYGFYVNWMACSWRLLYLPVPAGFLFQGGGGVIRSEKSSAGFVTSVRSLSVEAWEFPWPCNSWVWRRSTNKKLKEINCLKAKKISFWDYIFVVIILNTNQEILNFNFIYR